MSDALDLVYRSIDEQHADLPGGHATEVRHGGCGHDRQHGPARHHRQDGESEHRPNSTETILAVAATAEVLATIVNTVGWERGLGRDAVTQRNIKAAAREELVHYNVSPRSAAGRVAPQDLGAGCGVREAAPTCSIRCRSAIRSSSTPT